MNLTRACTYSAGSGLDAPQPESDLLSHRICNHNVKILNIFTNRIHPRSDLIIKAAKDRVLIIWSLVTNLKSKKC